MPSSTDLASERFCVRFPHQSLAAFEPWKLGGLSWKDFGQRLWQESEKDEILAEQRSWPIIFYWHCSRLCCS